MSFLIKGNLSSPKLVFIMTNPLDIDVKKKDIIFPSVYFEYSVMSKAIEQIGLTLKDIAVVYLFDEPQKKITKKKEAEVLDKKDVLFEFLGKLNPDESLIVTVGSLPTQTLINVKNITQVSGTIKRRKIGEKEFKVIPLISPFSVRKSKSASNIFLRSINIIKKIVNNETDDFIEYKILEPEEVPKFARDLIKNKSKIDFLFYDIETSSLSFNDVEVIGVAILTPTGETAFYIPLHTYGYTYTITESQREEIKENIRKILLNFPVVGHNIKFDIIMTVKDIFNNDYSVLDDVVIHNDTMLMAHIIDNKKYGSLSLKNLAKLYFNLVDEWDKPIEIERKKYAKSHKIKYSDVSYKYVPTEILGKYACYDVFYTRKLYDLYNKQIIQNKKFVELNKKLIDEERAVVKWEYFGVKVDIDKYNRIEKLIINKVNNALYNLTNLPTIKNNLPNFNPNSPQQIAEVIKLYKLPIIKKTKSGNPSTDAETLENYLKLDNIKGEAKEFVKNLYEYKFYNKAKTAYVKPIKRDTDYLNIFRTSFRICGTVTGRLSSYLHTLPSRTSLGKNFKGLIISRFKEEGFILSADFSQLEPRTLASLSGDKNLIQVYKDGKDIYKYMASEVYHKPYEEINKSERNSMKALVLAIMYGMSESTFAERTGCSVEEAEVIFKNFFNKFSDVKRFIDKVHREGFKKGGIETYHGRFIPIETNNISDAKRKMQNYIIQSTASELALFQFSDVTNTLYSEGFKSLVANSVHDSIVIDTHISEFFEVYDILMFHCNKIIKLKYPFIKVPMVLDAAIGVSWGNSLEIEEIDKKERKLIVTGYRSDLDKLLLTNAFDIVNVIEENEVEVDDDLLDVGNLYGKYELKYVL